MTGLAPGPGRPAGLPRRGSRVPPSAPPRLADVESPALDPWIGRLVDGRYEVVSRLARGGMATVYRAVDRRLDRTVAVKIMHVHLAESPEFVARFRREARAAARLSHPGIVAVHDQGMAGETSYLVMELVEGPNLRTILRERGSLPLGDALDVVDRVLDALAAAHRAGLIHRDIKPENVLLTADGRPKVADFGLARAVSEATAASTGTVLGTVAYLAPEIVTSGVADARADVYATGVLLYELLTGRQPFTGEVPIQVAFQHVNGSVPAPSAQLPWVPAEVDELVAAFTARDVDERVPDAIAARELLRRCRASLDAATLARRADVTPAPPPPPNVLEDSGSTAVTGLREGHGTVALPIGAITHQAPAEPVRRRRRGPGRTALLTALLAVLAVAVTGALWWFQAGPGAYTLLPDVAGRSQADAVAALEEAGLDPAVEREHHDDVPAGEVIGTDPGAEERVRRGASVRVVVSEGVLMIEVPDVVGETREDAERALTDAGLPVGEVDEEYSDTVPAGVVLASAPGAGEVVRHDTAVGLVVSAGREPADLADVRGLSRDDAVAALEAEGLVVEVAEAHSDTVAEGAVIEQDPAAGSAQLYRGDTVTITVSLGPELVAVPDVVGSQVDEAQRTLEAAGFAVRVEEVLGGFFGTVRAMDPQAGTMVPRGTAVTLTVV